MRIQTSVANVCSHFISQKRTREKQLWAKRVFSPLNKQWKIFFRRGMTENKRSFLSSVYSWRCIHFYNNCFMFRKRVDVSVLMGNAQRRFLKAAPHIHTHTRHSITQLATIVLVDNLARCFEETYREPIWSLRQWRYRDKRFASPCFTHFSIISEYKQMHQEVQTIVLWPNIISENGMQWTFFYFFWSCM